MPLGGHGALEESHEDKSHAPPLTRLQKMSMPHRCYRHPCSGHGMLHVLLLGTQVRISFTHQVQGSHTQHIFPSPVQVSWSITLHLIY